MRLALLLAIVSIPRLVIAEQAQPSPPALPPPPTFPIIDEAQLLARLSADPRLARVAAEIDAARAEALGAGALANPGVDYEREEVLSGEGLTKDSLRLSLPLELSGRRAARRAVARPEVAAVTAEGDAATFALTLEALRSFRIAQYERARSALLRDERAALAGAVEIVRRRTAAGATSGYDLQRIELELAGHDDSIAVAGAQLDAARLELGALVERPAGVDAAGDLEVPGDPAALAAALAEPLERRPEARAAAARAEGARSLGRAAGRAWIPDLVLTLGLLKQDVTAGDSDWGYTAGLALALPFFDRGQADRARARARQRGADATRRLLARTVSAAIRARHAALVQAIARARSIEQAQLARLPQLLRSAETAYRDGGGNIVELVDAYTTARELRLRALELRRDAQLAQLDYWLALGRRP